MYCYKKHYCSWMVTCIFLRDRARLFQVQSQSGLQLQACLGYSVRPSLKTKEIKHYEVMYLDIYQWTSFHYQCHFTEVQLLFSLAASRRLAKSFEHFIPFPAVCYGKIFPAEPVFATMGLKSSTLLEAWLLSVQNGISNHNLKLGIVARASKEDLLKIFLSYMAWSRTAYATQGPISTHPLSHSRESLYG